MSCGKAVKSRVQRTCEESDEPNEADWRDAVLAAMPKEASVPSRHARLFVPRHAMRRVHRFLKPHSNRGCCPQPTGGSTHSCGGTTGSGGDQTCAHRSGSALCRVFPSRAPNGNARLRANHMLLLTNAADCGSGGCAAAFGDSVCSRT